MGTSGSGRISDYPGSSKPGQSGGSGGGRGPEDRCARAFSVDFEDVEQSDYFKTHSATPAVGTQLEVVLRKRLVAQTANGESIGSLPTSFNYLAACLKDGWRYIGTLRSAQNGSPVAKASGDFAATPPV